MNSLFSFVWTKSEWKYAAVWLLLASGLVAQPPAGLTLEQFQQRVLTERDTVWLVDFYASWCRPCLDATTHLLQVYPRYADKPVRFVGLSLDESAADWHRYVERFRPAWPQMRIGRQSESVWFREHLPTRALPTLFVVEPGGRIREVAHWWQTEQALDKALIRMQRRRPE